MPTPVRMVGPAIQSGSDLLRPDSFLPVANGTHFNGNGGATSTSLVTGSRCYQTRKLLRVIAGGADQLQVEWANIWTSNTPQTADASCEIAGPNSVTVRMAIEYPAGNMRMTSGSSAWSSATAYIVGDQVVSGGMKWVAITAGTNHTPVSNPTYWEAVGTYIVNWSEQTDTSGTVVFAADDYKKSMPIALGTKTVAGKKIAILGAFDSGSSSNYIPYAGANGACNLPAATPAWVDWVVTATSLPAVGSSIVETGITTQTNGNTTTSGSMVASAWMKIPYATAITGNIPIKRCVALFGDSLMQGTGGDVRDGEPAGIFVRSCDGEVWWRVAQGGNRAGCYVPGNAPWQMSVIARCTAVVTNMCMNDIDAGLTFAQTQAAMWKMWQVLQSTGVPVYAGYLTPISASSDSWATTANQSRYTGGGTIATTQNPNDDATYLTSVYGLTDMWLHQDGAVMTVDGVSCKVGQPSHPIEGLIDWRALIADPATSWKWNIGIAYTTDGAHPTPFAAAVQAAYTAQQMEPVFMGRRLIAQAPPQYLPHGEPPIQSMPRHQANGNSPSEAAAGTFISVIGVSPGRYYYGFRIAAGAATAAARNWTLLAGANPAKLKVLQSGSFTPTASTIKDTPLTGAPIWIPAGQVIVLALTVPITTANVYVGVNALYAGLNQQALGFVTAGKSTNTAVLSAVISIFAATAGSNTFAPHAFRAWTEMY